MKIDVAKQDASKYVTHLIVPPRPSVPEPKVVPDEKKKTEPEGDGK